MWKDLLNIRSRLTVGSMMSRICKKILNHNRGGRSVVCANRFFPTTLTGNGRFYSSSTPVEAKILASDAIEKICGEHFRSRGHELDEKPGKETTILPPPPSSSSSLCFP